MNAPNQHQATDVKLTSGNQKATNDWTVTTSDGRSIVMRKPPNSSICRLSDLLGSVPDRTFNMYFPLLWVQSIDGDMQNFGNRTGLDFLLNKLGDAYVEVVEGMNGGTPYADEVEAAKK